LKSELGEPDFESEQCSRDILAKPNLKNPSELASRSGAFSMKLKVSFIEIWTRGTRFRIRKVSRDIILKVNFKNPSEALSRSGAFHRTESSICWGWLNFLKRKGKVSKGRLTKVIPGGKPWFSFGSKRGQGRFIELKVSL